MPYKDPAIRREYMRKWERDRYRADPERFRKQKALWRAANRPKTVEYTRRWQRANPKRAIFNSKRAQARLEGIEFSLSFDALLWPEVCPVLGIALRYERSGGLRGKRPYDDSPSFDRLDTSKGYEPGNVLIVSNKANRLRSNATTEELRKVAAFYTNLLG